VSSGGSKNFKLNYNLFSGKPATREAATAIYLYGNRIMIPDRGLRQTKKELQEPPFAGKLIGRPYKKFRSSKDREAYVQ